MFQPFVKGPRNAKYEAGNLQIKQKPMRLRVTN